MRAGSGQPRRVLIVGARFGEIYLNAFLQAQPGLQLAGLLAHGSARAQQLAHAFGIPLYRSLAQLPQDIDIACVVVRSTVVGGSGTALAQALLERGIHVLQEHPLHPDDIARLQQVATRHGCCYWVNSFYPHTPAGRCWIVQARRIRACHDGQAACFAHLASSRQLLYSALDLLLQASQMQADCQPGSELQPELCPDPQPELLAVADPAFHLLRLSLPGCKALLRLQTYLDPALPDLHSLVMHQLTLGWPAGYLTLEASYGPVLWSPAWHDQRPPADSHSLYHDSSSAALEQPTLLPLHQAPADWRCALEIEAPAGVAQVLQMLCACLDGQPAAVANAAAAGFSAPYQLALARLWQQILRAVGAAQERSLSVPPLIAAQLSESGA